MDVTKSNFNELLPQVKEAIDSATFIAIDGEFTGLNNGPDVTIYDLPEEYYNKFRTGKMDYLLVQVGLCMFTYNKSNQRFTHKAFNFYLFPHSIKSRGPVNFLCEASTLEFLLSNGFDFNKVIKEGITYLSYVEETNLREELDNRYKRQNVKAQIPDDQVDLVEQICRRIGDYLNSDNSEELVLDEPKRFTRKLVYQAAYEMFSDKSFTMETRIMDSKTACLVIKKGRSKEDQKREDCMRESEEITSSVGFSNVIRYLSESKKLIIGHNMLLDLCHMVNRFYTKLPANYKEFKYLTSTIFPKIVDTKYMCNSSPLKDLIQSSVLGHMISRLRTDPFQFVEPEPDEAGYGYSFDSQKEHEAGYDAYITGCAFITMVNYLGRDVVSDVFDNVAESHVLKPYKNRIHLMRLYDNAFINLAGNDVIPVKRDHVFLVTFPHTWQTADILKLFEPYGNIHVSYCSSTSAWVTLYNESKAEAVMNGLVRGKDTNTAPSLLEHQKQYSVMSWHQFQSNRADQNKSDDEVQDSGYAELVKTLRAKKRQKKSNNTSGGQTSVEELESSDGKNSASHKRLKNNDFPNVEFSDTVISDKSENVSLAIDGNYENTFTNNARNTHLTSEARQFLMTDIVDASELDRQLTGPDNSEKNEIQSNNNFDTLKYLENSEQSPGDATEKKLFEEHAW